MRNRHTVEKERSGPKLAGANLHTPNMVIELLQTIDDAASRVGIAVDDVEARLQKIEGRLDDVNETLRRIASAAEDIGPTLARIARAVENMGPE